MLRHSPKGSKGWIQINPVHVDPLPAADSRKLPRRRSGRWRLTASVSRSLALARSFSGWGLGFLLHSAK
jgi:hypothetical protein